MFISQRVQVLLQVELPQAATHYVFKSLFLRTETDVLDMPAQSIVVTFVAPSKRWN